MFGWGSKLQEKRTTSGISEQQLKKVLGKSDAKPSFQGSSRTQNPQKREKRKSGKKKSNETTDNNGRKREIWEDIWRKKRNALREKGLS